MRKNKHHDDLMWFFNNAHSAAGGPRSNFQSSMSGIRTLDFEPSDANLEAVARERRIRRTLAKIPPEQRAILAAFFTLQEERCCPMLRAIYAEHLRVARIRRTRDSLSRIRTRKEHDAILADAKRNVKEAIRMYSKAAEAS